MKHFPRLIIGILALLSVSCEKEEPFLNVSPSSISFGVDGGSQTVTVKSNTSWNASAPASWISISPSSGSGDGTITVTVPANSSYDPLIDYVTVAGTGSRSTVTVSQSAAQKPVDPVTPDEPGEPDEPDEPGTQENHDREALEAIYSALGGSSSWDNWCSDKPISTWREVYVENGRVKSLYIPNYFNAKGQIPEEIGDLDALETLVIYGTGVSGKFPEGIFKLTSLKKLDIEVTSISGHLPDKFETMSNLEFIRISTCPNLDGPLPVSLGNLENLKEINFMANSFTGTIPEEWCKHDKVIKLYCNQLSGQFPLAFYYMPSIRTSFWESVTQGLSSSQIYYHMDISNAPFIPSSIDPTTYSAYDGRQFTLDEVISKNEYTVKIIWKDTNPYANILLHQLKDFYEKYHDKGFEIVAWAQDSYQDLADYTPERDARIKSYVQEKGFDKWYNIAFSVTTPIEYQLRLPFVEVFDKKGNLVFSCIENEMDTQNKFFNKNAFYDLIPFLEEKIGPLDDDHQSTDFSKDGEVITLQKASKGNGINIVFMGDGYTDKDMGTGQKYETTMKQAMEEFFAIEPYTSFRDWFNVYAVKAVSKDGSVGKDKNTVFSTFFDNEGTHGDIEKCFEYAQKVPGINSKDNLVVITMINARDGSATTYSQFGYNASVAFLTSYYNTTDVYGPILRHEAGGHAFAHLADEYAEINSSPSSDYITQRQKQYKEKGWWANVDYTSDKSSVKWAKFLKDSRYDGTIGIYEGGDTYAKGVYRPTEDSMMNNDQEYFNAPSREAIYKRIMELSGEKYSFEEFVNYDLKNIEADRKRTASGTKAASSARHR